MLSLKHNHNICKEIVAWSYPFRTQPFYYSLRLWDWDYNLSNFYTCFYLVGSQTYNVITALAQQTIALKVASRNHFPIIYHDPSLRLKTFWFIWWFDWSIYHGDCIEWGVLVLLSCPLYLLALKYLEQSSCYGKHSYRCWSDKETFVPICVTSSFIFILVEGSWSMNFELHFFELEEQVNIAESSYIHL